MTKRTVTFDDAEWQVVPKDLPAETVAQLIPIVRGADGEHEAVRAAAAIVDRLAMRSLWRETLAALPEPPAQEPEPVRVWYMRDNHTFLELPLDIDEAISALRDEWPSGQTCGMLCSKEVNEEVHAHGEIEPFIAEVRAWYDRHGIGKGESNEG